MRANCGSDGGLCGVPRATASAHHSHGQYAETFQDIEGVVKELHLLTPHSWLYIEVKDAKGAPQLWALEATTRAQLEGMGVTRDIDQARRDHQGALPPAARQEQRLPPRVSEDQGRNGQGLGRRQRSPAEGFLASSPCASPLLVFGLLLSMSGAAGAQEWAEYTSLQDGFRINFPGQPTVTDEHVDVTAELRAARACLQRREGPRALLGHCRRLQQHRAAGHRARQVVSARQRQLPRERARDARRRLRESRRTRRDRLRDVQAPAA